MARGRRQAMPQVGHGFAQGMAGMIRRMYDGGVNYSAATNIGANGALSDAIIASNRTISIAAWMLAALCLWIGGSLRKPDA